jgi:hypothetical protein
MPIIKITATAAIDSTTNMKSGSPAMSLLLRLFACI